jgi:hypothetical protein
MSDVRITDIDGNAKQTLLSAGWATEATLREILNRMGRGGGLGGSPSRSTSANQTQNEAIVRRSTASMGQFNLQIRDGLVHTKEWNDNIFKSSSKLKVFVGALGDSAKAIASSQTASALKGVVTEKSKFEDIISGLGGDIGSFSKTFGDKIPFVGKLLGGLGSGLGLLTKGVGAAFSTLRMFNEMENQLYSSGIYLQGGFRTLTDASIETGVKMQTLVGILTKFGAVTVTLGTKRLTELSGQFARGSKMGAEYMMNTEQTQEAFMDTLEMLRATNELTSLNDAEILQKGRKTVTMFNELALESGRNREQLRQNTLTILKSTESFAAMRSMGKEGSAAFTQMTANLQAQFGNEGGQQLSSLIAKYTRLGMAGLSETERAFVSMGQFGPLLDQARNDLNKGKFDPKVIDQFTTMLHSMPQEQLKIISLAKPEVADMMLKFQQHSQQYVDSKTALANMTEAQRKDFEADQESKKAAIAAQNAADAAANAAAVSFQRLVRESLEPIIPKIPAMAEGFETLIRDLNKNLMPHMMNLGKWIDDNILKMLDEKTKEAIKSLREAFTNINWKELGENIQWFSTKFTEWKKWIEDNPWAAVLAGLGVAVAGVAAALGAIALPAKLAASVLSNIGGGGGAGGGGAGGGPKPGAGGGAGGAGGAGGSGTPKPGGAPSVGANSLASAVKNAAKFIGKGLFAAIAIEATDTIATKLGVGTEDVDEEQDKKNWEAMSAWQKLQSGIARGIETAGGYVIPSFANQARSDRVKAETAYLGTKIEPAADPALAGMTPYYGEAGGQNPALTSLADVAKMAEEQRKTNELLRQKIEADAAREKAAEDRHRQIKNYNETFHFPM